ncbi:hypothetical protein ABPG72_005814 [Tetrahymena utriculariae]
MFFKAKIKKSQQKYQLILLLSIVQILHINCSLSVLSFIEAVCQLNQQIESFQRNLLDQQQSFIDSYEKLVAPSLVRNKQVERQIPNLQSSFNQQAKQQIDEAVSLELKDSNLCQDVQCINNGNFSRRILQTSNENGQIGNENQPYNQDYDDDIQKKKLIFDDEDDLYLQTFVKYEDDPFIYHVYMKEHAHLEYNLALTDADHGFDYEYQVPKSLIYQAQLGNQTYKVIALPKYCPSHSQNIIQKRYLYYCDEKRISIQQYAFYKKQNQNCYKIQVYMEACHCPVDKYGTFCTDQLPITCNVHSKIDQVKNQNNQNGSKRSENTLGVFYDKVGTIQSQGFNINIKCNNQRAFVDILNKRLQTIDGLCAKSETEKGKQCKLQQFNYTYFGSASDQLNLTDKMNISLILEVSNLNKVSQPLILNYTFTSINSAMLLGKESFNIPIFLKDISSTFPSFQSSDFLQFGKLWYSIQVIGYFQQSNFTDYEISLGYWNGVLVDESYVEPKLNYFQLLTINKWDLLDYVFIILTLFLLLVACLLLLYVISESKKIIFKLFLIHILIKVKAILKKPDIIGKQFLERL